MDRFLRGLIAGIIGGIAMNLWTLIAVGIFNWQIIRFIDWAAVILYGQFATSHAEGFFALVMQILWSGTLGVIFAFLIPHITSSRYLIKGAVFGLLVGFITYAIPTILQMPILKEPSFITVVSNHMGGAIWGLTTAQTLRWLDEIPRVRI
ncbi:MAG: hypothetical protein APF76_09220 [Desulfitibacter sp. BRH_c19]|nr:MAG: hypothetical protein APF76_09220 [Desulfitibacter sp. BRH_c19]